MSWGLRAQLDELRQRIADLEADAQWRWRWHEHLASFKPKPPEATNGKEPV